MSEFEYFAVIGWKRTIEHTPGVKRGRWERLGEARFESFPDENDRSNVAKNLKADYITIEKRYEYDKLPFEE